MDAQSRSPEYVYAKLPSPQCTRILELCPALDPADALQGILHDYPLHDPDARPYECISYVWGPPVFSHTLVIRVGSGSGSLCVLRITASLHEALHRFRRRTEPRLLWADAVCINQQDAVEKSLLLPRMADVYRGAARVLVWLGQQPDHARLLARVSALDRFAHGGRHDRHDRQDPHDELCESVVHLLGLPWFRRRWVVQEVVMNPHVVFCCGAHTTAFLHLVRALHGLPSLCASPHTRGLQALFDLWQWWALFQVQRGSRKLHVLLADFDHLDCADARDRVFTLAALSEDVTLRAVSRTESLTESLTASPPDGAEIVVDYRLPTETVYAQTAQVLVCLGHLRWVIGQAAARAPAMTAWPSWVPDWRRAARCWPLALPPAYTPDCFYATKPTLRKAAAASPAHLLQAPFYCAADDDALALLAVTWRGETFPASGARRDVLAWMAATFATLWARLQPALDADADPAARQAVWEQCVDRFGFALTGGGHLVGDLGVDDQQRLAGLQAYVKDTQDADPTAWYASSVVRRLLLDPADPSLARSSMVDTVLALITATMQARCLFTCDVDGPPPPPPLALAADVLGIGAARLHTGDRVVSVSDFGLYRSPWDSPVLVREAALPPETADAIVHELGSLPPAYRLVGDCLLTTLRWPSRIRTAEAVVDERHVHLLDCTVVVV